MNPSKFFQFLQNHKQWALPATYISIGLYLALGLFIINDYGISWDEPLERYTGLVNIKYIIHTLHLESFFPTGQYEWDYAEELHQFRDRYYGSWFQVLAISLEQIFNLKDMYSIVVLHHVINFLVYVTGVFYLSRTIQFLFNTPWLTLLVTLLFITQPRFFAEAFYNSKDVVLLAVVLIAIYYIAKMMLTNGNNYYWALAAFFTGLAIATRVIALSLFAEVCLLVVLDIIFKNQESLLRRILQVPLYIVGTIVFTILLWPYLWSNPKANFMASWEIMQMFHWDGFMLFMGNMVRSTELPWNYIPQWIFITVPVLILMGIVWGFIAIVLRTIKLLPLRETYLELRMPVLFAGLFAGPIAMVIYLHSVLYDGWRHLYLIEAGGILLCAYGIWTVYQWAKGEIIIKVIVALLCLQISTNLYALISLHPYQNVYFNSLAGDNLRRRYEMDYWGLTYRKGFEYLLEHDQKDTLRVVYTGHWDACNFHKPQSGRKFISTGYEEADYLLSTYRNHPENYTDLQELYTIRRGKDTIMSVFKLKKP